MRLTKPCSVFLILSRWDLTGFQQQQKIISITRQITIFKVKVYDDDLVGQGDDDDLVGRQGGVRAF